MASKREPSKKEEPSAAAPAAAPPAPAAAPPAAAPARSPRVPDTEINGLGDLDPALQKFLYNNPNPVAKMVIEGAELKTGVKRERLAYGLLAFISLYLIVGSLAQLICNLIGFAYPAHASVLAVRSDGKDDDTQWLIYWCCFASFSLLDFWAERIMSWFPIYWLVKTIFLLYLSLPQTRGALTIYAKYVDPMVTYLDKAIDTYMKKSA